MMAYSCDLGAGQSLYLVNVGEQTSVTLASSSAGQQQQSTSSFATGAWTAPPEIFRTGQRVIVKLTTAAGAQHIQLQGSQLSWMPNSPDLGNAQAMSTGAIASPPQQPMQPMQMGDMEMKMKPMEMRMGNMEMRMGQPPQGAKSNFCSQCGTPVKPSDRFCANCGHQLSGIASDGR